MQILQSLINKVSTKHVHFFYQNHQFNFFFKVYDNKKSILTINILSSKTKFDMIWVL